MKTSTARKLSQILPNQLIVGIDPHKHMHACVIMTEHAKILTQFKIANSRQGFEQLLQHAQVERLRAEADGLIFAIEAGSHCWRNLAYYLDERGWPLRLISPFTLKRQREGQDLDRRKNDFRDATMAAELLRIGRFTETHLLQGDYAELRAHHQCYQRLRHEYARTRNLLRTLLDGLFPEFCGVFKDPCGQSALAVLSTCADPALIAALSVEQFIAVVRRGLVGRRLAVKKLQSLHALAGGSIGVRQGRQGVAGELQLLVGQLRLLASQIEPVEEQLCRLVQGFEESRYLLSVPGLSAVMVAGLLAEIGPFAHYGDGKDLVKLAGTNPTQSESAGKGRRYTPMSKKGRAGLRSCLWQATVSVLRRNEEFRAWAKQREERVAAEHPLHRREVLGAVMNKLLRLCYALVSKGQLYRPVEVRQKAKAA